MIPGVSSSPTIALDPKDPKAVAAKIDAPTLLHLTSYLLVLSGGSVSASVQATRAATVMAEWPRPDFPMA